jgi:NinB protein
MHTTTLTNAQQARETLARLFQWARPRLMSGARLTLSVGEEKRSNPQNAKLHSLIGEIAAQKEWAGQRWEAEVWKRLLTAAWMRANGQQVTVVPSLDGMGVDVVFARTSKLSRAECSDLLEYVQAWAAQNGVRFAIQE